MDLLCVHFLKYGLHIWIRRNDPLVVLREYVAREQLVLLGYFLFLGELRGLLHLLQLLLVDVDVEGGVALLILLNIEDFKIWVSILKIVSSLFLSSYKPQQRNITHFPNL